MTEQSRAPRHHRIWSKTPQTLCKMVPRPWPSSPRDTVRLDELISGQEHAGRRHAFQTNVGGVWYPRGAPPADVPGRPSSHS